MLHTHHSLAILGQHEAVDGCAAHTFIRTHTYAHTCRRAHAHARAHLLSCVSGYVANSARSCARCCDDSRVTKWTSDVINLSPVPCIARQDGAGRVEEGGGAERGCVCVCWERLGGGWRWHGGRHACQAAPHGRCIHPTGPNPGPIHPPAARPTTYIIQDPIDDAIGPPAPTAATRPATPYPAPCPPHVARPTCSDYQGGGQQQATGANRQPPQPTTAAAPEVLDLVQQRVGQQYGQLARQAGVGGVRQVRQAGQQRLDARHQRAAQPRVDGLRVQCARAVGVTQRAGARSLPKRKVAGPRVPHLPQHELVGVFLADAWHAPCARTTKECIRRRLLHITRLTFTPTTASYSAAIAAKSSGQSCPHPAAPEDAAGAAAADLLRSSWPLAPAPAPLPLPPEPLLLPLPAPPLLAPPLPDPDVLAGSVALDACSWGKAERWLVREGGCKGGGCGWVERRRVLASCPSTALPHHPQVLRRHAHARHCPSLCTTAKQSTSQQPKRHAPALPGAARRQRGGCPRWRRSG